MPCDMTSPSASVTFVRATSRTVAISPCVSGIRPPAFWQAIIKRISRSGSASRKNCAMTRKNSRLSMENAFGCSGVP